VTARAWSLCAVLLAACTSEIAPSDTFDSGAIDCSPADRRGPYSSRYVPIGDDCGDIVSQLRHLLVYCEILEESWSPDSCRLWSSMVCISGDGAYETTVTEISWQLADDGSLLSGAVVFQRVGAGVCEQTYMVELVRVE
jgi:hypothetical protein